MCFSISLSKSKKQLENSSEASFRNDEKYQPKQFVSAFTKPLVPIITDKEPNTIRLFNWGLIPHWVKSEEMAKNIATKTFNARSETVHQKPSFRDAFRSQRCVVLADGFYEWRTDGKIKTPYHIFLEDHKTFAFAGIYNTWVNRDTGEVNDTFSILTQESNPFMSKIHNLKKRQPILIHSTKLWLEKGNFNTILTQSFHTDFKAVKLDKNFRKTI